MRAQDRQGSDSEVAHLITTVAYLDRTRKQMSIVRETSSKWRAVIERELWSTLGELELRLECVDLAPELDHFLLFRREIERRRD